MIPYHKFLKAEENNFTVGSRFKMKFESDESTERRYGTYVLLAVFHCFFCLKVIMVTCINCCIVFL